MLAISNIIAKDKTQVSENSLSECISIKEGNKNFNISENASIILDSYNFDICIDNISIKQAVFLFAYHNTDYMNKYSFPIDADKTEIFCTGSGMAEFDLDHEKGYSLGINKPFSFHYLFERRRINKENSCIIPVRKLIDPAGKFTDKLCLSIFVDYNGNRIIEENEYAAIEISFSPLVSFDVNDFSEENRGYNYADGKTVKRNNYNNKNYQVYKITSEKGFEKFIRLTKKNFLGKTPRDYFLHYFDQKNLEDRDIYLLMAPNNLSFKENPFRIIGRKTVFFEVIKAPENKDPVSIITLEKEKNDEDFQISFLIDGEIIPAQIKSF